MKHNSILPILGLAILLVLLSACSLSSTIDPTAPPAITDLPPTPIVVTATSLPVTSTTAPTSTVVATTNPNGGQSGNLPPCTPRTDLPTYIVATGDTLGSIATRAGSTSAELTRINCLTNPNIISVGQVLRVPRAVSPPPTATVALLTGAVNVTPVLRQENGAQILKPNSAVTLTWNPLSTPYAGRIRFYYTPTGTGVSRVLLGSDENPTDGVSLTWVVPANTLGYLSAEAVPVLSEGVFAATAQSVFVAADLPSNGAAAITITSPANGTVVNSANVAISGTATGLFEQTFVLEMAQNPSGRLITSQIITYSAPLVGSTGSWTATLNAGSYTGKVDIRGVYTRPSDGARVVLASTTVEIKPNQPTSQVIVITTPANGATVPSGSITVSGTGQGLFENTFSLTLSDTNGQLLTSQVVTYTSAEVGGLGSWSATLNAGTFGGAAVIRAVYSRPSDGQQVTLATANITITASRPVINSITVSPTSATAGSTLAINWSVSGANGVLIRVLDADGRSVQTFNNQAVSGSLNYTIPAAATGSLTIQLMTLPDVDGAATQSVVVTIS